MGLLDDMENKSKDIMADPNKRAKIEQMAKEKGMSIEEAKTHFLKNNKQD